MVDARKAIRGLETKIMVLEGKLSLLDELERESPSKENHGLDSTENRSITEIARAGMAELGQFTKRQLEQWMRQKRNDFSFKHLERIVGDEVKSGKVRLIKPNIGNKSPALYKSELSDY